MPMIHDLLANVARATWLTKVDMNKGFYQVPPDRDSQDMTAFCSPWGKFTFTRMPFGHFQRCMQNILSQQSEFSLIYIDDVLIYFSSWKEHLEHIRGVLEALREAGLTTKPNKCVWGARSLEYLGHEIGNGLVSIPEAGVKALSYYHKPKNQNGLRAFLRTAGYYRRFIPDFARWAGPLFDALKKGFPCGLEWNVRQCTSFNHLIHV